jgi:Immunity protein 26
VTSEGTWFAVPLPGGGFATGVVTRARGAPVLLGYFFGPRVPSPPASVEAARADPRDAVLICRFGETGLESGDWAQIGLDASFERGDWAVAGFGKTHPLTDQTFRVVYDDDNPAVFVREEPVAADAAARLPADGLLGAEAVAAVLDDLLAPA